MNKWWVSVVAVFLSALAIADTPRDEVTQAALLWLQKVDGKQLQQAYDDSGTLMKNAVAFDKWSAAISSARASAGNVQSRDLTNIESHTQFPGVPEGDYMIVKFKTKFSLKPDAQETLSFQRESDGKYHLIGYFVR